MTKLERKKDISPFQCLYLGKIESLFAEGVFYRYFSVLLNLRFILKEVEAFGKKREARKKTLTRVCTQFGAN